MSKMGLPLRKTEKHFTYGDYRQWPDDERWELIDGVAYNMCAAPRLRHQGLLGDLYRIFRDFLRDKECEVWFAPVDVFFPRVNEQHEDDVDTIVQPDLVVVCDQDKQRPNGIWGAPDLLVEILSPSTSRKDQNEKFDLYQRSGVKEYWVVDPAGLWLQQYVLAPGTEGVMTYGEGLLFDRKGIVVCPTLPGFTLDVESLWPGE